MLGSSRAIVQSGGTSPCYDADFLPFDKELAVTNTQETRCRYPRFPVPSAIRGRRMTLHTLILWYPQTQLSRTNSQQS
ncbi:MAG TPA: hypothetical protein VMH00_05640 [Candidatus Limnocylindrales bacterium]|nr:hypothetical protein [Candidatus Limnocylindrales bacterium]